MKILLVEDDERIREAIAEDLRDQNYVVEIAQNGEEAGRFNRGFSLRYCGVGYYAA